MKPLAWILAVATGALTVTAPAFADVSPSTCINVVQIDHTQVLDDNTILFFLKGGGILKNTLPNKCFGLSNSPRGFSYRADNDEVCGNLQTIHVNQIGSTCMLGPFTSYAPDGSHP